VSFVHGLLAGRSHLAFLLGLAAAALTVRTADRIARAPAAQADRRSPAAAPDPREPPLRPRAAALDRSERRLALAAWSYLERNADPATGFAPSVKGARTTTMWDAGSQLMGILAAEDLGLVSEAGASHRLERIVASIAAIPLCEGGLPNKSYDVRTLEMVDYGGAAAPQGIGWSALDVARVLVPLGAIAWRHPELTPLVRRATSRWRLEALTDGAALRGATRRADGVLVVHQEGRLGYEQLAAKALLPWAVPVAPLLDARAHLYWRDVHGAPVACDDRRPRDHGGTLAPALSEPWILDALENGLDAFALPVARGLLVAQQRRFAATGRLTAVSEDALDRPPWFSYSAVLNGDSAWTAFAPDGAPAPGALTFSTKAAVAWGVLFEGSYPDRLLAAAAELVAPGEGLYAGRYDATGAVNRALSLNTNAVVLEALAYRVRGPRVGRGPSPVPAEARR
jgi:hypothetical protein